MDQGLALLLALNIAIYAVILAYVKRLEAAGCAPNWRRTYIKYFIVFLIILEVLHLMNALLGSNDLFGGSVAVIVSLIVTVGTLIFTVVGIQYVNWLWANKEKCSEGFGRDVLLGWCSILAFIVLLNLVNVGITMISPKATRKTVSRASFKGRK